MASPTESPPLGSTDLHSWRLDCGDGGRHAWLFARDASADAIRYEALWGEDVRGVRVKPQSVETRWGLGLPLPEVMTKPDLGDDGDPYQAAKKGFEFFKSLQSPDGHWAGGCVSGHFLTPGIVFSLYITETHIPDEWKIEMSRYLARCQRDGGEGDEGWGLDTQGKSSVFGTSLNYVTLRLLGVDAELPMMVRARATLHKLGGSTGIPSWGKFWLAVLNLHDWAGLNPLPPEAWLLPEWLPLHPHRWWCQSRLVFTPMSFLYRRRFQTSLNPLLKSLRQEIYIEPYESIRWSHMRNNVAASDLYSPHSLLADVSFGLLQLLDPFIPSFLSKTALERAYRLIVMEDENTTYQTIAPVSKALNMVCRWVEEGPESKAYRMHVSRVRDFLWMGKDGMTVCGTNGSQAWDAAFMAQALYETGLAQEPKNVASAARVLQWLDNAQMRDNTLWLKEAYRHPTKGGWTFSTSEQSYAVSDCTAEALKAVVSLQSLPGMPQLISRERMRDAIDLILSYQNSSGGFSSFEPIRGPVALELFNTSEVFGNVMVEYSYPECTTACLTAIEMFRNTDPNYRARDIALATRTGIEYIRQSQRADGTWYGSWGVCFTYGTLHAVLSLSLDKETFENSARVRKACEFLLSKQMVDGGWGESFKACETHTWVNHAKSQVVHTAWAILTLLHAKYPNPEPIRRGCELIVSRQLQDGSWEQESVEGVFNHTVGFAYPNFRFIWPIWALGKAARELKTAA